MAEAIETVILTGSAYERGLQQALQRPELVSQTHAAIHGRLESIADALSRPEVASYLKRQFKFIEAHDDDGFQETLGIAHGLSLPHATVLTYLHANVLQDILQPKAPMLDGCTSWAMRNTAGGSLVVKNRDYRGEHGVLQQVFLHVAETLPGKRMICVGSLGSPGAFSSGMNARGLAVVDTQIGTHDHGVGWLRYFLMTALLRQCESVDAALEMVLSVPHVGGGTLILGDASGCCASVELGHTVATNVIRSETFVAKTNHYLDAALAATMTNRSDDLSLSSVARLRQVQIKLGQRKCEFSLKNAQELMATHKAGANICSHANVMDSSSSRTLSSVIYDTADGALYMTNGNPCEVPWRQMSFSTATITQTFKAFP